MTLLEVLAERGLTGATRRKALQTGKVFLRGAPTGYGKREVDPADVRIHENAPRLHPGQDFAVVFRDKHMVVVYKPSGMLSVGAPSRAKDPNLVSALARLYGQAHPVHRLDEGTSGLMMVALTTIAQKTLKKMLEEHDIERGYLAITHNEMKDEPFSISSSLGRNPHTGLRASVHFHDPEARQATTHFVRQEALPKSFSVVRATLETGRTHQVRIHLSERKHPVLGDPLYGRKRDPFPRLALHAAVLGFVHPLTEEPLRFDIGLADDMARFRYNLLHPEEQPAPGTRKFTRRKPNKGTRTRNKKRR